MWFGFIRVFEGLQPLKGLRFVGRNRRQEMERVAIQHNLLNAGHAGIRGAS